MSWGMRATGRDTIGGAMHRVRVVIEAIGRRAAWLGLMPVGRGVVACRLRRLRVRVGNARGIGGARDASAIALEHLGIRNAVEQPQRALRDPFEVRAPQLGLQAQDVAQRVLSNQPPRSARVEAAAHLRVARRV